MGKKKDERKRREREAEMAAQGQSGDRHEGHAHDAHRHEGRKHEGRKHDGGAPFAGIAATIARQMGTPVGRQMIAAGLMAAATAISKHDAKASARPTPPTPPPAPHAPHVEPVAKAESDVAAESTKPQGTGPFAGDTPEPPRSEATTLPPEFAKVLDSVAVGLERLFVGFGKPTAKKDPPSA